MAYFDNAATTYPKPESVYVFMDEFYRSTGASVGRGNYALSCAAGSITQNTREQIKNLLHCPAKEVLFQPTATIALNIIIQGLIESGITRIFISPFEHNAVTRILHHYESSGKIEVFYLSVSENLQYDFDQIRYQFDKVKPDLVIVSHASNVIGLVAPIEELFLLAKRYGAITLVDMAQTAGLVDLNVGLSTIDFAVFAGHKSLYGPTGISGFIMKPDLKFPSILFGGTGYDSSNQKMPERLPEKYEMGTLNISAIAGLNAALKWLQTKSINTLYKKDQENRIKLLEMLSRFPFIKLNGYNNEREYIGIVSCMIDGISADSAGSFFSRRGIAVRTGLHCSPCAHQFLGTHPEGTIRLSASWFTTDNDFNELQGVLMDIEEGL